MTTESPVFYDAGTDSMYVRIRPGEKWDQIVDDARDLVIDLDRGGDIVGYDIQSVSEHMDVVAEALALLRGRLRTAA